MKGLLVSIGGGGIGTAHRKAKGIVAGHLSSSSFGFVSARYAGLFGDVESLRRARDRGVKTA
jgi:hypothetical protein